jgi:hypothetical protein
MKRDKAIVGAAGEHLVMSRLLNRGFLAALAPSRVKKVDILVNHLDGKAPCLIQVKTRSGIDANAGWPLNEKNESIDDADIFYCFVALGDFESQVYVIPASQVAKVVRESHAKWLRTLGAKGQKHNDSDMRSISNAPRLSNKYAPEGWMDKYLEKWELIQQ